MRPVIRSLFVLSVFGVLAAHVSTGFLQGLLESSAPALLGPLNRSLQVLLIAPFGREVAVYALLGLGGLLALWAYVAAQLDARQGRGQGHSTW